MPEVKVKEILTDAEQAKLVIELGCHVGRTPLDDGTLITIDESVAGTKDDVSEILRQHGYSTVDEEE